MTEVERKLLERRYILIICLPFIFQSCMTAISDKMGRRLGEISQNLGKKKECNFEEILKQKSEDMSRNYARKTVGFGTVIDITLADAYRQLNPGSLSLGVELVPRIVRV